MKSEVMRYEVLVRSKPEVLDPEARAIHETLNRLGMKELKGVEVSRRFLLELEGPESNDKAKEIATKYLANPVSEVFTVQALK